MKYLSVCAGIEAATVAWHPLGWEPVAFSEIEKFPNAVLQHHYPGVPNFGDMNDFQNWPDANFDVLVGGTPCQSFSVAGLRKGMADPRGNLALIYLAIANRYRPRWLVWENVPGVLSSNEGRDFGSIIGGMVKLGYGISYRVLDAQYFGVPQRRRRVFVVGCLDGWRSAAEVLFEPESLQRNPPPSREPREGFADDVTHSLRGRGFDASEDGTGRGTPMIPIGPGGEDISHALSSRDAKGPCSNLAQGTLLVGALDTSDGLKWGSDQWVAQGKAIVESTSFNWQNGGGYGEANDGLGIAEDQAGPQSASQVQAVAIQEGMDRPKTSSGPQGKGHQDDLAFTLESRPVQQAVAFRENQRAEVSEHPICDALLSGGGKPGSGYSAVREGFQVRRLMPIECERLQGFPDNYTNIPGASDSARYKALGNSMAVPVMHWIGKRIHDYEM